MLDLHGVNHIDVSNTVKRFLEDILASGYDYGNHRIVTGHSTKMKQLVLDELALYGVFHFYFEPASIVIYIKEY